jgi:hypothetical protein
MRKLFRTGLVVSAMALVAPAGAVAQVTTRYDGTYTKVSSEPVGGTPQNCPPVGTDQLVITGGIGHMIWGDSSLFSGWVDPHGLVTLQATNGLHFDAQIETKGTIKATVKLPACSYAMVWQKKP